MKIVQPFTVVDSALTASNVLENEYPAHVAGKTYALGDTVQVVETNVHKVFKSLSGSRGTVTISTGTTTTVTWVGHGFVDNDVISFSTTGTLPTGITAGTVYYVKNANASAFNLSTVPNGGNLATSGTQSGVHTGTGMPAANYNKDPKTSPTQWLDMGSTNKWKMFDQSVQTQTKRSGAIEVTVATKGYINTVAFLNLAAASVRVIATHSTDGIVYDQTKSTSSSLGITDLYMYFYSSVKRVNDVLFENIPMYANLTFQITITNLIEDAACGACILGEAVDISSTGLGVEQGAKLGIQDYSLKEVDEFGNYSIQERAFNRRHDYTVYINNADVDYVYDLISKRRATPTLYIGSNRFGATLVYGFYKDFSIDIAYYDYSVCSFTLEGLT